MAETIVMLDPTVLKVHPRNNEFFDDINGAEFDRLVDSIRTHGVLTPLRATKDMTIISGHQRIRAAIKAECHSVPVIIDESENDDDVLMKLIETNFGRIENDPIKQAKLIKEYEELKGVCRGGDRLHSPKRNNFGLVQDDIAKELGVSTKTLQNLKSLLKLDPVLQQYISDGNISSTTGFKLLTKLSPEEQRKLVDALPDDVKFTAASIKEYINKIREDGVKNISDVQKKNDALQETIDALTIEKNELLAGTLPDNAEHIEQLQSMKLRERELDTELEKAKKENVRVNKLLEQAIQAKSAMETAVRGGDAGIIALQTQLDEYEKQLKILERERNDLEYQLSEKEDQIRDLTLENKEGYLRKALSPDLDVDEYSQRKLDSLASDISNVSLGFIGKINGILVDSDQFALIDKVQLSSLVEIATNTYSVARNLMNALMAAGKVDCVATGDAEKDADYNDFVVEPEPEEDYCKIGA